MFIKSGAAVNFSKCHMASLVDYEDSDSDEAPRPLLDLCKDQHFITNSSSRSSSSSSSSSLSRVSVTQSLAGSSCLKRVQPNRAAVRPYVAKRPRVSAAEPAAAEPDSSRAAGSHQLLFQESLSIRPFVGRNHGRSELPRRVRWCVRAHEGPVNTLQWSPVEHLSHLLLSASMDRTCKVWDGIDSGRCLQTYSAHGGAVRDACWLPCGRRLLSGSFDGSVALTDVETGKTVVKMENEFKVGCVAPRPSDPDVFLCGGFSSEVKAWDTRSCKVLRVFKADVQQTLDILFLSDGEFVSSTDAVSRDSAERTLIAWDFNTTAKISNQIFHERYTCPCLTSHPLEKSFVAQTNGSYIALFSAQRPYRMNKRRRYEGHEVEGFAVHCGFSADGRVLVSGSSTGSVHFYDFQSSRPLNTLQAHDHACICAALHPVLPAAMASCDWSGQIKIWN